MNKRVLVGMAIMGGLVFAAILYGSNFLIFIDFPSVVIVVGITVGGTVSSFPGADISQALRAAFGTVDVDEATAARSQAVLDRAADAAVSSGLVGTLIGLVMMLANLDDPTTIGPAMAVALLTLFYGTLLGELFLRSMATDVGARGGHVRPRTDRRGTTTVYASMGSMFVLLFVFMVMLLAFCDWV